VGNAHHFEIGSVAWHKLVGSAHPTACFVVQMQKLAALYGSSHDGSNGIYGFFA
jgi:hypothetical protein